MRMPFHGLSLALRRLLVAQVPSDMADWIDFVAIGALMAYIWSAPPEAFALLAVAIGLPYLIVGPLVSVWVDRADLRQVMIWANIGRGVVTLAMFFAPSWPVLLALVCLRSAVDSAYSPAKQAALQAVAPQGQLARANSLSFGINQMSKLLIPAMGGGLLTIMTAHQVFIVNACLSFLGAALLLRFPRNIREAASAGAGTFAGVTEAIGTVRRTPLLRFVFVTMALAIFANFIFDTQFPPLMKALDQPPEVLGLFVTSVGFGAVLGSMLPSRDAMRPILARIAAGAIVGFVSVAVLGMMEIHPFGGGVPLIVALGIIIGVVTSLTYLPVRIMMQKATPPEHMARVAALSEALNTVALLTAPFIGAAIVRAYSVGWAFIVGGALFCVVAVLAMMERRRHE